MFSTRPSGEIPVNSRSPIPSTVIPATSSGLGPVVSTSRDVICAPTTIMWWQGVPLLHAVVLPVALWGDALARLRRARRWARRVAVTGWAWGATAVALTLLMAFGGRRFRCGGEDCIVIPLRHDHPMLHDLRITESCPPPIVPGGWWPDVLPESGPDGPQGLQGR